jgi:hypothetical protein
MTLRTACYYSVLREPGKPATNLDVALVFFFAGTPVEDPVD